MNIKKKLISKIIVASALLITVQPMIHIVFG